ncbi:hypothetical protein PR048_015542 [Dryococelus australis]|uniref:Transposase n=1 Tax=Dryococelus australis TaxID=614101 RepID=A0ABQ9HI94_9NEOP|nr:hypothetical protein PR048_015542 [Dryococelus australis]
MPLQARHRNDIQPPQTRHLAAIQPPQARRLSTIHQATSGIRQRASIIWPEFVGYLLPARFRSYGAAPERKDGGNGISPRKPTDQRHRRHDSHMRESGYPAGDCTRIALVGNERSNHTRWFAAVLELPRFDIPSTSQGCTIDLRSGDVAGKSKQTLFSVSIVILASSQILLRQREPLHSFMGSPACMLMVGEWDVSQGKPYTPWVGFKLSKFGACIAAEQDCLVPWPQFGLEDASRRLTGVQSNLTQASLDSMTVETLLTVAPPKHNRERYMKTEHGEIKSVDKFKCLGEWIQPNGLDNTANKERVRKLELAYRITQKYYNKKAIYGAECLTMNKNGELRELESLGTYIESNKVLRMETQIASEVIIRMEASAGVYISPDLVKGRLVFCAADNIDFQEDTPYGKVLCIELSACGKEEDACDNHNHATNDENTQEDIDDLFTSVDLCDRHTLQAGFEPVDKEMARGTELSDFDKGVIVGCNLSGLSSRVIARKVNRPKSTVAFVLPTHKPHITTSNKARRLRWCLDRRNCTLEQWKLVLWSDESKFTLFRPDGRVWVWRLPGERLLPECIVPTRKFGGGCVMVWGCFTAFGVGSLVFVRGRMNTETYCIILDNDMLPTLRRFYGMDPCYFQDDNARCHVSRATMQWYANNNVRRFDWPAQSPDLNPIEHL